jgi:glutamate/tyrosine decarboxylase-like PLP-dependent enzyme
VLAEPRLELLAPVNLNIVCFRYRADDAINREIVADVQESGLAAPSSTTLNGKFAIRAAIVNHRTAETDIDALLAAVIEFGARRTGNGLIQVEAPPLAAQ